MIVHKNIRVKGNVQGVFYRASTVDVAKSLGLKGYVRNEPDGSVFIEAEGEEEIVKKLIEWARNGPPHARVDNLEIIDSLLSNFTSFEIRR
jgi:acylphosphatase